MICLDTNVVIAAITNRIPSVRHRLGEQLRARAPVCLPAVALYELRYGCARSERRAQSEAILTAFLAQGVPVLPFEAEDADHAGDIRAQLEKAGQPIGHYDYLIAAQARRRSATLVTANTREFLRVPGLLVADWAA